MEAHPRPLEAYTGVKEAYPDLWQIILKPWRLTLEL
jgi:hypothetical protein